MADVFLFHSTVLAVIFIFFLAAEELMFPPARRVMGTTATQQRWSIRITSPTILTIDFAHESILLIINLVFNNSMLRFFQIASVLTTQLQ